VGFQLDDNSCSGVILDQSNFEALSSVFLDVFLSLKEKKRKETKQINNNKIMFSSSFYVLTLLLE
jgi:hypothetical protein